MNALHITVPDISCQHCVTAITGEVGAVAGVSEVRVDLATTSVDVRGAGIDPDAVYAAIADAGYDPQV